LLVQFYISFLRSDLAIRITSSITGIININSTLINTGFQNAFKNLAIHGSIATHIRLADTFVRKLNFQNIIIIIIIIIITITIISHQLDLDKSVSASSNSPFKGLPSLLRPFGL
jgi:hypothetical protein